MSQDIQLLEQALTHTGQLLEQVTPGQYGLPTPCEEFDVRALVGHLLAGNPYYVVLARGGAPDFALFAHDHLGGRRPGEVYAEGAEEVLAAWRTKGALQRRMPLPGGGPGPRLADLHLLEAVLHGWDLATATGQDRTGDPDAVEAVLHTWYGNHPDAARTGTGMFGPARSVPADAPASDRLAAYFGRTVRPGYGS
ncbi:TIGR03086 family metal-binding protein [Streptomyces lavendulae]|uniref:TIGR03086 family metal-binding protein n=1 Tax=Streptomyces lavendulae TaxID=1914 RepID=UPI0024A419FE|nr:TIGR03086 family protein [Streptomyces roseochromogenus]